MISLTMPMLQFHHLTLLTLPLIVYRLLAQEAETNISAAATGIEGIGTSTDQATSALEGYGFSL